MYAIIKTGGKQYRVSVGDVVYVEKLNAQEEENVEFDSYRCWQRGWNGSRYPSC